MKNLETTGFTPLSAEDLQSLDDGGLVTSLLTTVEGLVNPLAALLDSLTKAVFLHTFFYFIKLGTST